MYLPQLVLSSTIFDTFKTVSRRFVILGCHYEFSLRSEARFGGGLLFILKYQIQLNDVK